MKSFNIFICFICFILTPALAQKNILSQLSQKKVTVHVTPADATIYELIPATKELKQIGIGTAVVVIQKNSTTTIILQKPGFADLQKVYSTMTDEKLPKEDLLAMKDRQVTLKVSPSDAKIIANGNELEKGSTAIIIKDGEKMNVEVKKNGYVSVNRTYTNQSGGDMPPVTDQVKLTDRVIQIVSSPSDAKILIDNKLVGSGHGDIVVPLNGCIVVKIVKEGYIELEQTYCNKDGTTELPTNESFALKDRLVMVRTPADASIKINGRNVGKGEYNVKILKGECIEMITEKDGFEPIRKTYCNQDNAPVLPVIDNIEMAADEAFAASSPADFVNINNIIEINPTIAVDAWKTMSQVVLNVFDVIEITDKETGYLRTAWVVKTFPNNTIRTRLILKVADSNALKYTVKLVSEASGKSGSNINDDSLYSEWHRVLNPYKNVVSEIQSRLK